MTLATLAPITTPYALYTQSSQTYMSTAVGTSILYNQQNGQSSNSFSLVQTGTGAGTGWGNANTISGVSSRYFTMNVPEYNIPSQVSSVDQIAIGIWNNTIAGGSQLFQLNMSPVGNRNNVTYYTGTGGAGTVTGVYAPTGFRTERGSKVASITPDLRDAEPRHQRGRAAVHSRACEHHGCDDHEEDRRALWRRADHKHT